MESNNADFENEELVDQSLELVRGINKYLRKALKKIESLRKMVEPVNDVDEATESSNVIMISSEEDNARDVMTERLEIAKPDDTSISDPLNGTRELSSSNTSLSSLNLNNPIVVYGHSIDNNTGGSLNNVNNDGVRSADKRGEPLMKIFKYDQGSDPFEFGKSFQMNLRHQFFRAFIANLPGSVDHKGIKSWLKSNNVDNCDDIVINRKQNYSTCILSFCEQSQRDHVLDLNGKLFEGAPLKISPFEEVIDLTSLTKRKNCVLRRKY